jgi:hypothetical protein
MPDDDRPPLPGTIPVLAGTIGQMRSFVKLVLSYTRTIQQGEPPPVPPDLFYCAAASMYSQIEADIAINGSAPALRRWDDNLADWLDRSEDEDVAIPGSANG